MPQLKRLESSPRFEEAEAPEARTAKVDTNKPLPKVLPQGEFVETLTAKRCLKVFRHAQLIQDFTVIYGGAGLGKSTAASEHQRRAEHVWVVVMTPEERRLRPCISRVARAIGIGDACSVHDLDDRLKERLEGKQGLLIVDEAQNLQLAGLECLRFLHEYCPVGITLMGNTKAYTQLTGGRVKAADFAPLFSRLGMRLHLTVPSAEDVELLSQQFGVIRKEDLTMLHEIAQKPGALRNVTKTLTLAYFAAKVQSRPIDSDDIWTAFSDLMQEQ